ncbi:GNAT family N-acetyltransferase [Afipia massiliensis]|uniref:GNAT family N-acetyltransferase n=1 Tax=Afipia massiliensis TaxID=211460 RepID=A0A4U6BMZ0_9BRAD|nr:GNAT family N-acetyltransferase [Afipia massiliensis]TKT70308.1 GNAT family N-acetyltransferase [Afipia massiliensis]
MDTRAGSGKTPFSVEVVSRDDLKSCAVWPSMFAPERKDHRYYEIVEDALTDRFEYRYFAIVDDSGKTRAIQPFFLIDQDIVEGVRPEYVRWVSFVRRINPRFLKLRTLMVGCSAGEGHLACAHDLPAAVAAESLSREIVKHARALGADLIVLKEFPARYREALACFVKAGFTRAPSMPMTMLNVDYESFDAYASKAISGNSRRHFRKNLKAAEGECIRMSVTDDVSAQLDEIYPLYLQVYERSKLRFEKLTRDYFRQLSVRMKDKVRFLLWHRGNRLAAFGMFMIQEDQLFSEYLGFDYAVALDLHLYHYVVRDMTTWAIECGFKGVRSSGLNYDPKLRYGHRLDPIDLYVRHVSPLLNPVMKLALPWLQPVRYDATLKKFPNYGDLW